MIKLAALLLVLSVVNLLPAQAATTTIDPTKTYQTIEGLGGATAFYEGWIPAHPYQQEIYTNAFAGLNLSMLRLGDWYRYQTPLAGFDSAATTIVSNANRVLGHPVPVFMSSWAPPAFLKSNGQTGNGGTLLYTNGSFAYTNFAQYWYDSINAYQSNGVSLTWMSIQNEPDWAASYDSCVFYPSEQTVNGTNYASYSLALNATYQLLTNLPSPPKLLAPECVGIGYNDVQNFSATMNSNSFYGVTHHLYGGSTDGSPDGYTANLAALTNVFPSKPHFMTEFGYPDMINTACLIHNCLTIEQDAGFNYWSLVWPFPGDALVQIENPYNLSSWTNAPPGVTTQSHGWWLTPAYWAMKHFSYFIQPGFRRVSETDNDNNVRGSAYLSPNGLRLVVVMINTNATASSAMTFNFGIFNAGKSSVYQTAGTNTYAGTNTFLLLGALASPQTLPPLSLTTIVLDQTNVAVGVASNPLPANNASGIALNSTLTWTAGSNALGHALYLGINSNLVAQDTMSAPEFQGVFTTTNFSASLLAGLTYYWRVDEIAGVNSNTGAVWSFTTVAPSVNFALSTSDVSGSSSFSSTGNWVTNGTASAATTPPGPGGAYNTGPFILRSPTTGGPFTFAGSSLTISPGGSLYDKVGTVAMTVYNLTNNGVGPDNAVGGIFTLSGNMFVPFGGGGMNTGSGNSSGTDNRTISCGMTISGPGALTNYSADPNWPSHPTAQGTVIYTGNNSTFTGPQVIINNTVVQVSSQANLGGNPANFNPAQLLLNNGTLQPLASFALNNPNSGITIGANGGIFNLASGLTLTVSNPIAGSGNLLCAGGGILQIAGSNSATGNLMVSNSTLAALGTATFGNAQLGVGNNATLDVTALAVPLAIGNGVTLAGNLRAAINKTNFTSLLAASNIIYGGTLILSNLGLALAYGDTIKLFSASNYSGTFSGIIPAVPGPGLIWNTNWLSMNGTIFISSTNLALITPPRITSAWMLGGNLVVAGTNGNAPGTFFYTLASTNLASSVTNWTVVATNQFGPGGGFSFTNLYDAGDAGQFFRLRLP
jgi:O-glycosyl hydrolase